MLLESYLIGASVHFLMNAYTLDSLARKRELVRDRASKSLLNSEINACADNMPMALLWPVDFGMRLWKLMKIRP